MAAVPIDTLARAAHIESNGAPRRATVLLVDDDATTRVFVRYLLESTQRFRVVGEAENGAEGVTLAASLLPDLVVLDIEMPIMNGRDAIPLIRKASAHAKIVVFSGRVGDASAQDLSSVQADLLVAKGVDCSTLVPALLSIENRDESRVKWGQDGAPSPLPH